MAYCVSPPSIVAHLCQHRGILRPHMAVEVIAQTKVQLAQAIEVEAHLAAQQQAHGSGILPQAWGILWLR
jgi:hypothetical protein